MPKILDDHYNRGRKMFAKQGTLRTLVQALIDTEHSGTEHSEDENMSAVVGFADAALDAIRGIKR